MTLLITLFAAIISTILWYTKDKSRMKLGVLSLIYWGATLMWLVDAVAEYIELKESYFAQDPKDMLNDAFLGLSAVALGLLVWLVVVLLKDPKKRIGIRS